MRKGEQLHRQAFLVYRYRNGHSEEHLRLGAELFYLLLELADGYSWETSRRTIRLSLSIFVQRLVAKMTRTDGRGTQCRTTRSARFRGFPQAEIGPQQRISLLL